MYLRNESQPKEIKSFEFSCVDAEAVGDLLQLRLDRLGAVCRCCSHHGDHAVADLLREIQTQRTAMNEPIIVEFLKVLGVCMFFHSNRTILYFIDAVCIRTAVRVVWNCATILHNSPHRLPSVSLVRGFLL